MPDMKSLTINGIKYNIIKYNIKDATARTTLDTKANTADLAKVTTSGSYSDLSNTPTKVSAFANDAGYLTAHQSLDGYAKMSIANTWGEAQHFKTLGIGIERYTANVVSGTSATPAVSGAMYTATGAFTLDMSTIASALSNEQFTVFSARFFASSDYALTITNAGTLSYVGSASNVAIKSTGTLVNIFLGKNNIGSLTSIVQAIALSAS